MILSRLILNDRHRAVYHDLGNAHALHQRIMQAFPDEARATARADWNVLYRVEPEEQVVMVQSDVPPDWSRLPEGYLAKADSKALDPLLGDLKSGQQLRFRLKANPSKRENQSRKVIGFRRPEDQEAWLHRQAERCGFLVLSMQIGATGGMTGRPKGRPEAISLETALYDGLLEIVSPETLLTALHKGIGRGRAFGCGLLSIAPVAMPL